MVRSVIYFCQKKRFLKRVLLQFYGVVCDFEVSRNSACEVAIKQVKISLEFQIAAFFLRHSLFT